MSVREERRYPGLNLGDEFGGDEDRSETQIFGFWVFLMSDFILFGLMIAIYITMIDATAGGPGPRDLFNLHSIFLQTAVLLLSSATIGFAGLALKYRMGEKIVLRWLVVTLVLGLTFLGLELADFIDIAGKGGVPQRSGFLSAFYSVVLLHGLHVSVGSLWLAVLIAQVRMFGLRDILKTRILKLSLYWHFLDLIWIWVFTVVFLGGWSLGS